MQLIKIEFIEFQQNHRVSLRKKSVKLGGKIRFLFFCNKIIEPDDKSICD